MIVSKPTDSAKQLNGAETASPKKQAQKTEEDMKKQRVVLLPL